MRINGQSSMNIAQMLLTDGSRTWVSKHSNILKKECRDEYIQGIIQPSITYSNNSAGTRISRSVIDRIKYNSIYKIQMPEVTPHVCRYTFCSNMAKSGLNPKTLQYIMGHSDISVTLNTYTHVGFDDVKEEMQRITSEIPLLKTESEKTKCE